MTSGRFHSPKLLRFRCGWTELMSASMCFLLGVVLLHGQDVKDSSGASKTDNTGMMKDAVPQTPPEPTPITKKPAKPTRKDGVPLDQLSRSKAASPAVRVGTGTGTGTNTGTSTSTSTGTTTTTTKMAKCPYVFPEFSMDIMSVDLYDKATQISSYPTVSFVASPTFPTKGALSSISYECSIAGFMSMYSQEKGKEGMCLFVTTIAKAVHANQLGCVYTSYTASGFTPKVTVNFKLLCEPAYTTAVLEEDLVAERETSGELTYNLTGRWSGVCPESTNLQPKGPNYPPLYDPRVPYKPSTSSSSSLSGSSSSNNSEPGSKPSCGMSPCCGFLIFFILIVLLYFTAVILYALYVGKRGFEVVPNVEFWSFVGKRVKKIKQKIPLGKKNEGDHQYFPANDAMNDG